MTMLLLLLLALPAQAQVPSSDVKPTKAILHIGGPITPGTVRQVTPRLERLTAQVLEIQLNSPGGSMSAGVDLLEIIDRLRSRGVKVHCHARTVYSMAAIIWAWCPTRSASADSKIMFHEARLFLTGDVRITITRLLEEVTEAYRQFVYYNDGARRRLGLSELRYNTLYTNETVFTGKQLKEWSPSALEIRP